MKVTNHAAPVDADRDRARRAAGGRASGAACTRRARCERWVALGRPYKAGRWAPEGPREGPGTEQCARR